MPIGTNTFLSITPAELTSAQWNGSVFVSYGGGTFVEDYSAAGAWVAAGTGGHAHTDNPGGAIFDFEDATWKLRRPADSNAQYRPSGTPLSASNGAPWLEYAGTTAPVPPHPYCTLAPLPARLGGGARGSVIYVTRSAVGIESTGSRSSHRFDLATGAWTRASSSMFTKSTVDGDAVFDAPRRVYWLFTNSEHVYSELEYLDTRDWTVKRLGAFPTGPSAMASGRVLLYRGLLIRHSGAGQLYAIDPDQVNAGWRLLRVSGTLAPNAANRYAEWRGKFYWAPKTGGNVLHRLTPPADLINGTWVADTVTLNSSLPPHQTAGDPGWPQHYSALFAVPSLDSLAWIAGGSSPVYLVRPE